MKLKMTGAIFAVGLTFSAASQAGGVSAEMLGNTCAGCHGLNGVSAGTTMPTLAGMPRDFIYAAMKQYKDGSRGSTIMGRIAKGYNDEQLAAMSDFFARQKWTSAPQKTDAAMVKRGEKLHVKRCEACHRENGVSMAMDMPRMAGQWEGYLRLYMETCLDPKWKNRHPNAMTDLCGDLSGDDLTALVQFYASQK